MKDYLEDIPWRDILHECIAYVVILIVYFAMMAAISAPSIAWMAGEDRTVSASATDRTTPVAEAAVREEAAQW